MGSNPSKIQRPNSSNNTATGSDEYMTTVKPKLYEFVCTTCARDNKHVNASTLCKICQDYLCFKCLIWHGNYRGDHVDDMVGLDEMRKLGVQEAPLMPIEKCVAHHGETWNMLCPKDGVAGCKHCMEQDHRSCGNAIPRSSRQIEAVHRQMKKTTLPKDSVDYIEYHRNDVQLMHNSGGGVSGKLAKQFDRNEDGQMPERRDDVQVSGRRDHGQVPGRKHLVDTDDLQVSGKLKNVEQIKVTDQADGSKQMNTKATVNDGQVTGIRSKQREQYSVKSSREVNVRVPSDIQTCSINDLCLLTGGRILISDNNNRAIKLLDSNLNISDHVKFQYYPYCVCMINDTYAAVSSAEQIEFMTIKDKIEIMRSIQLVHSCSGLAYSSRELYVSDDETNIHVYTVEGKKLRTMETGLRTNKPSKSGFEWLIASRDNSRLFLTNLSLGTVCIDRQTGKVAWKINDTDGAWYNGLCVDRNNNVLVCRRWKNDVVQISPHGRLSRVVINDLLSARSICIDENRGRLIVGLGHSDRIRVFDLKI